MRWCLPWTASATGDRCLWRSWRRSAVGGRTRVGGETAGRDCRLLRADGTALGACGHAGGRAAEEVTSAQLDDGGNHNKLSWLARVISVFRLRTESSRQPRQQWVAERSPRLSRGRFIIILFLKIFFSLVLPCCELRYGQWRETSSSSSYRSGNIYTRSR